MFGLGYDRWPRCRQRRRSTPRMRAASLEAIDVQPLPGQRVEIRLRLNEAAPEPMSFTIDDPARIALDLPDTALALPTRADRTSTSGRVTTMLAAEAERPHTRRPQHDHDGALRDPRCRAIAST